MNSSGIDALHDLLSCPSCAHDLVKCDHGFTCAGCGAHYPFMEEGGVDLRVKAKKRVAIPMTLDPAILDNVDQLLSVYTPGKTNDSRLAHVPTHARLGRDVLDHFPQPSSPDAVVLDLGCGEMPHKIACEMAGFHYVGLDYRNPRAHIMGDGQALPFKDEKFDFVLSIAALQEIPNPILALREAYRVLKPNGTFLGSVAFLEAHNTTCYHFTHLGSLAALRDAGFIVETIAPSASWTLLRSTLSNGLLPHMPKVLALASIAPLQLLHRTWWWLGRLVSAKATVMNRLLNTTGSYLFVARRPASQ